MGGIKAAVGAYVSKLRPAKPGQMTRIRLKEAAGNRIHGEIAADERQEMLWQAFFLDPTLWWDNRQEKRSFYHPDFRHKRLKEALWLDNRYKPAWVDSRLVRGDTGLEPLVTQPLGCASTWTFGNEVAQISGELKEAIEALEVLVQRGSYVNNALFYRVLKRCMAQKDLAIGRQVHEVGSSQMSS